MDGSGLDRTGDFQKFYGPGLDRIQISRIRIAVIESPALVFVLRLEMARAANIQVFGPSAKGFETVR